MGMPLHWTIQSEFKLATVVAEGDVVRSDIEAYLSMVVAADISAWRKLIDARTARLALSDVDVNTLGVRVRAADAVRSIGPLAFVTPEVETAELRRLLGFLAAAKRQMRIFQEFEPARKWILKTKLADIAAK
jgi:hypothetical protein